MNKLGFWGVIVLFVCTSAGCGTFAQEKRPYHSTERLVEVCFDGLDMDTDLKCVLDTMTHTLQITVSNRLGEEVIFNPPYPPYLKISIREFWGSEEWIPFHVSPDEKVGERVPPFVVPANGFLHLRAPLASYGYDLKKFDEKKEYVWRTDYTFGKYKRSAIAMIVKLGPVSNTPKAGSAAAFWVFNQKNSCQEIYLLIGMEPKQ